MNTQSFEEFLRSEYTFPGSGAAPSYLKAFKILEELFKENDIFNFKNVSLSDIVDTVIMNNIINFVIDEEHKLKKRKPSFFDSVKTGQKSYAHGGFCKAAIKKYGEYLELKCQREASIIMEENNYNGLKLSKKLSEKFHINDKGTEKEVRSKIRIGQNIFRAMLMKIYGSKCCISGLEIPEVLRASHIIPWSDNKENRLNPENGLFLSATYDAAFDKHLISFDEDYRLVISPTLKDIYSSEAFKTHFLNFEGKKMCLPSMYIPSQDFLSVHREKLIC